MPVYFLTDELIFPHPNEALEDGLLAVGGDLTTDRILLAYKNGIFPWYAKGSPILWWSPDPRLVLFPEKLKVSRSLQQIIRKDVFEIRYSSNFEAVIQHCAAVEREGQDGTWITDELMAAFISLHNIGYARSVETYYKGELVGGLYGLAIGKVFFGESMFHLMRDASKVALYHLVLKLKSLGFKIIDAQQETMHLKRLGAETIPRSEFLRMLEESVGEADLSSQF